MCWSNQIVNVSLILCVWIAATNASCVCGRPARESTYNKQNLTQAINDIQYYFPSGRSPPNEFTSTSVTLPVFKLQSPSAITAVFLDGGSGYRDQVGFFIYNGTRLLYEELLFPEATGPATSCLGVGVAATSSSILPAGTQIGFYLVSNGCNGGTVKFYSIPSFNTADVNIQHVASFLDAERNLLILGFDDLPGGDNDFNEVMIAVDVSNMDISFPQISIACVASYGPCQNAGVCDYTIGYCTCPQDSIYQGTVCNVCNCNDANSCTTDNCTSPCTRTNWDTNIQSCLNTQTCSHSNISGCEITTGTTGTTGSTGTTGTTGTTASRTTGTTETTSSSTTGTTGTTVTIGTTGTTGSTGTRTTGTSETTATIGTTVAVAETTTEVTVGQLQQSTRTNSNSLAIGLGVGIGVPIALLIVLTIIYVKWKWRGRKSATEQDSIEMKQ